jgi:hypothetical protein
MTKETKDLLLISFIVSIMTFITTFIVRYTTTRLIEK